MQIPSETPVSPGRASEMAEKANENIQQLSDSAHQTVDQVSESASAAARQLGAKGEWLIDAQRRWVRAGYRSMCRHPLTSVAIAAVAGLLLGRLAEGRSRCEDSPEHAGWRGSC